MTTIVTRGYSDNKHAWIQEFLPVRGGGGPGPTARKQLGQRSFFSPQLILQFYIGLSIVYLKNYNFPGFQRGPNNFQVWSTIFQEGPTFSWGYKCCFV